MAVIVRLNETIGTIRPALYSQFAEHIGGVIYDGIWVGPDSKVANIDGIRRALVEHVRRLGRVVVRWPGGCFADRYHWRDGIGRARNAHAASAAGRRTPSRTSSAPTSSCTFAGYAGSSRISRPTSAPARPRSFSNGSSTATLPAGSTTLADERAANGDPEPFGVRYWGVGNESWGCGGKFTPEDYCRRVPQIHRMGARVRRAPVPDRVRAQRQQPRLDAALLQEVDRLLAGPPQGWAAHYYCGTTGHALQFTNDQWYEMLDKANRMERLITDQWAALGEFDPEHKVKLVIDEWGCWHPAGTEINPRHLFEQMGCSARCPGGGPDPGHFQPPRRQGGHGQHCPAGQQLALAVPGRRRPFVATPTFHVFEMYRPTTER